MSIHSRLEELSLEFPICEYAFASPQQITFSDKVHMICERDCSRYGHSWACPPNAGNVAENIARVSRYNSLFFFSTVWEVEDAWNTELCLEAKKQHEEVTRAMREKLLGEYGLPLQSAEEDPAPPIYFLSSGCSLCEECACPDAPCRHPQERLMSMESHGILILALADELGICHAYDNQTVVYFSMVLFNE